MVCSAGIWLLLAALADTQAADYHLYFNGEDAVNIPAKAHSGFAAEMLHHILPEFLAGDGITVNATHVKISTKAEAPIRAGFSRSVHTTGSYSEGVTLMNLVATPLSLFPDTVALWAEKFHEVSRVGYTPTYSEEVAAEQLASQTRAARRSAESMEASRNSLVYETGTETGSADMLVGGGLDYNWRAAARDYAYAAGSSGRVQEWRASSSWATLSEKARVYGEGTTEATTGSQNSCYHYEMKAGMELGDGFVAFPLNDQIVAYRGQVESHSQIFEIMSGVTTFSVHPDTGALEMYMGVSAHMYMPNPMRFGATETAAGFFVGPPSGIGLPSGLLDEDGQLMDGRDQTASVPSSLGHRLFLSLQRMPQSYELLHQDYSQQCETLSTFVWALIRGDIQRSGLDAKGFVLDLNRFLEKLRDSADEADPTQAAKDILYDRFFAALISTLVPCGAAYLRTPRHASATPNYYDILEYAVWAHFLLEADLSSAEAFFNQVTYQGWDQIAPPSDLLLEGSSTPIGCPAACARRDGRSLLFGAASPQGRGGLLPQGLCSMSDCELYFEAMDALL